VTPTQGLNSAGCGCENRTIASVSRSKQIKARATHHLAVTTKSNFGRITLLCADLCHRITLQEEEKSQQVTRELSEREKTFTRVKRRNLVGEFRQEVKSF